MGKIKYVKTTVEMSSCMAPSLIADVNHIIHRRHFMRGKAIVVLTYQQSIGTCSEYTCKWKQCKTVNKHLFCASILDINANYYLSLKGTRYTILLFI